MHYLPFFSYKLPNTEIESFNLDASTIDCSIKILSFLNLNLRSIF